MSHFLTLVIGDDVEQALAPFHEFECTGRNDEFVQNVDKLAEARAEFEKATETLVIERADGTRFNAFDGTGNWAAEVQPFLVEKHFRKEPILPEGWKELRDEPAKDWSSFADWASSWYGVHRIDGDAAPDLEDEHKYGWIRVVDGEVTELVDRTNPQARWDWFQIGGRYAGRLLVKNGAAAMRGERSWTNERKEIEGYDSCLLRDLDMDAMLAARRKDREAAWADGEQVWWPDYRDGMTREEFIAGATALSCIALVKDGEWYEMGRMGWFGAMHDAKDREDWNAEVQKLIESLPPETRITVVDCHI